MHYLKLCGEKITKLLSSEKYSRYLNSLIFSVYVGPTNPSGLSRRSISSAGNLTLNYLKSKTDAFTSTNDLSTALNTISLVATGMSPSFLSQQDISSIQESLLNLLGLVLNSGGWYLDKSKNGPFAVSLLRSLLLQSYSNTFGVSQQVFTALNTINKQIISLTGNKSCYSSSVANMIIATLNDVMYSVSNLASDSSSVQTNNTVPKMISDIINSIQTCQISTQLCGQLPFSFQASFVKLEAGLVSSAKSSGLGPICNGSVILSSTSGNSNLGCMQYLCQRLLLSGLNLSAEQVSLTSSNNSSSSIIGLSKEILLVSVSDPSTLLPISGSAVGVQDIISFDMKQMMLLNSSASQADIASSQPFIVSIDFQPNSSTTSFDYTTASWSINGNTNATIASGNTSFGRVQFSASSAASSAYGVAFLSSSSLSPINPPSPTPTPVAQTGNSPTTNNLVIIIPSVVGGLLGKSRRSLVSEGIIEYFGVSSNILPIPYPPAHQYETVLSIIGILVRRSYKRKKYELTERRRREVLFSNIQAKSGSQNQVSNSILKSAPENIAASTRESDRSGGGSKPPPLVAARGILTNNNNTDVISDCLKKFETPKPTKTAASMAATTSLKGIDGTALPQRRYVDLESGGGGHGDLLDTPVNVSKSASSPSKKFSTSPIYSNTVYATATTTTSSGALTNNHPVISIKSQEVKQIQKSMMASTVSPILNLSSSVNYKGGESVLPSMLDSSADRGSFYSNLPEPNAATSSSSTSKAAQLQSQIDQLIMSLGDKNGDEIDLLLRQKQQQQLQRRGEGGSGGGSGRSRSTPVEKKRKSSKLPKDKHGIDLDDVRHQQLQQVHAKPHEHNFLDSSNSSRNSHVAKQEFETIHPDISNSNIISKDNNYDSDNINHHEHLQQKAATAKKKRHSSNTLQTVTPDALVCSSSSPKIKSMNKKRSSNKEPTLDKSGLQFNLPDQSRQVKSPISGSTDSLDWNNNNNDDDQHHLQKRSRSKSPSTRSRPETTTATDRPSKKKSSRSSSPPKRGEGGSSSLAATGRKNGGGSLTNLSPNKMRQLDSLLQSTTAYLDEIAKSKNL